MVSRPLNSIQGLRAAAAFAVVVYHSGVLFALPKYGNQISLGGWTELGQFGVDLFFVISGFIIANAHWSDIGNPSRLRRYLTRRFTRVYPTYWIFVSVMVVMVVLGIGTDGAPPSILNSIQSYSLIRLTPEKPPLPVAWTLFHEILFYAIFAVLIWNRRIGAGLLAAWIASIGLNFTLTGPAAPSFWTVAFDLINLEFVFGILVFLLLRNRTLPYWLIVVLAVFSVTLFVGAASATNLQNPELLHQLRLVFGLSAAFGLAAFVAADNQNRMAVPNVLVYLGNASFTLYLVHGPVLSLIFKILSKVGLIHVTPSYFIVLVAAIGATAVSVVCYALIEKPVLNTVRGLVERRQTRLTMG